MISQMIQSRMPGTVNSLRISETTSGIPAVDAANGMNAVAAARSGDKLFCATEVNNPAPLRGRAGDKPALC